MKQLLVILISFSIFISCSKDKAWSPADDIEDFLNANPYSVIFENNTDGDLYLQCDDLASKQFPILKQGAVSETYHGPKSNITVKYTGDGTHFTTIKKQISLSKEKTIRMSLTYP